MNNQNNPRFFEYHIDQSDIIVFVDENWSVFARNNGDSSLTKEHVLNTSLWDYISGIETSHIYELLFSKARKTGIKIAFPFRCDSPAVRRFMEMTISSKSNGYIVFNTKIIREEQREPVSLVNASADYKGELITMCSICKKVQVADTKWVEIEEAIKTLSLFSPEKIPRISHGFCKPCYVKYMKKYDL